MTLTGDQGAGEQLCGKGPGVVMGSEPNVTPLVCPNSKGGEQLLGCMNRDTFHRLKDRIVNPLCGICQIIFGDCVKFWPPAQKRHGQMVGNSVEGPQGGEAWSTCPMGKDWWSWAGLG